VIKHSDRPFKSIEEHDETMKNNWNSTVPVKNSVVRIIGDVAWKDHNKILNSLNGRKILVAGSHDKMPVAARRNFSEYHRGSVMFKIDGKSFFAASHCCQRIWERSHYGVPHLFGHSHAGLVTFNMSADVGVDNDLITGRRYFPIHHDYILDFMRVREQLMGEYGRITMENNKVLYQQDDVRFLMDNPEFLKDNRNIERFVSHEV